MFGLDSSKILVGAMLLTALAVSGCSSAGSEPTPAAAAAAARPVGAAGLEISSPSFTEIRPRLRIPKKNTCYADDVSPPLTWSGVPEGTVSLALIADEPEERISAAAYYSVPASGGSVHWILYNIPPDVRGLAEGFPIGTAVPMDGARQGINDFERMGYSGPCPPPSVVMYHSTPAQRTADSPHTYYFRLYALDAVVDLAPGVAMAELLNAMEGHILAYGETLGKYQGPRQQGWYTDSSGTPVPNTPTPVP